MPTWRNLPFDRKLLTNISESSLQLSQAAIENAVINEGGGHIRFPGLRKIVTVPDGGRVYLNDWQGDLIGVTSRGNTYRIGATFPYDVVDVTGVAIAGGGRVIFDKTENELVFCAGREILRLARATTEVLSPDAPLASHVGYLDGFLVADQSGSGRFQVSGAGDWRVWNPLDTFTAESSPDTITSLKVTPFRELLLSGAQSTEQFERILNADAPFGRRWGVGTGLGVQYSIVTADAGTFLVNTKSQVVKLVGQGQQAISDTIQDTLKRIDDWSEAWAAYVTTAGIECYMLQAPNASTPYGTKGITWIYDVRGKNFSQLYGWDTAASLPRRWPGWSHHRFGLTDYIGGDGAIYVLDSDQFTNDGEIQRVIFRTGHYSQFGRVRIDDIEIRAQRGRTMQNQAPGKVQLRVKWDDAVWSRTIERSLGNAGQTDMFLYFGDFGTCNSFQLELSIYDPVPWEFTKARAYLTSLPR